MEMKDIKELAITGGDLYEIVDEEELRRISSPKLISERLERFVTWVPTTSCTAECK